MRVYVWYSNYPSSPMTGYRWENAVWYFHKYFLLWIFFSFPRHFFDLVTYWLTTTKHCRKTLECRALWETCDLDQSDAETWPDQQKDNDKDKEIRKQPQGHFTHYISDTWEQQSQHSLSSFNKEATYDSIHHSCDVW